MLEVNEGKKSEEYINDVLWQQLKENKDLNVSATVDYQWQAKEAIVFDKENSLCKLKYITVIP